MLNELLDKLANTIDTEPYIKHLYVRAALCCVSKQSAGEAHWKASLMESEGCTRSLVLQEKENYSSY